MNNHIKKLNDPDYWKFLLLVIAIAFIVNYFLNWLKS